MRPNLRLVGNTMDGSLPPDDPAQATTRYFTPLGHDRGRYYLSTSRGGQVLEFGARDLASHGALLQLAPSVYWEMHFPAKAEGFNAKAAANSIIQSCFAAGIYDPDRIRGRGAWLDDGRTVLHLGDRLVVDGVDSDLSTFDGSYIYERGRQMNLDIREALTNREASGLIEVCKAISWEEREGMSRLLAGWLVIAPVCGAMPWRPHLYLTSEAGGGKSWVIDNLVKPILGDLAVLAQSKTTEAGLRGEIGIDARPVVFDEFESQNDSDRIKNQLVLDLARQASSEDGADILKGTQQGGVRRYRVRSCFFFSSINLGLGQAADESRTVVLTIKPPPDKDERAEHFERLKACHAELMTADFPSRLLARTLKLLPVIRQNCEVFAQAITRAGHSRRLGDTVGVLLSGAWSLRSTKLATAAEADAMVAETDWLQAAIQRSDVAPEWQQAINFLIQQRIRYIGGNSRPEEMPVGDLIIGIVKPTSSDAAGVSQIDARKALSRAGILVRDRDKDGFPLPDPRILIASSSDQIKGFFDRSTWATGWAATLKRAPGAGNNDNKTVAFGALRSKVIDLPLEAIV